ncbi:MAG: NTP transferase domain-containing protein [Acidobacteria bacterium]|nr:NTP transferase domain-containing protein [Acidobacteriota bacterium]
MQAVILAAGRGTRLSPVTDDRSKAMVPVLGRPLVDRVVETLAVNGLRDLVMVIGPDDDEIRRFFTSETSLDVTVQFVVQEERLGMAHALGLAAPLIDGPFVLSACDSLKPVEHVAALFDAGSGADGALSLMDVSLERVCLAAPVEMDEDCVISRIVEKPRPEDAPSNTVSLPLYFLPNRTLALLAEQGPSARGEYELQDAIQALIDGGSRLVGVKTPSRLQVSTPGDLLDLNLRFLDESTGGRVPETIPDGTIIQGPVWIDDGVTLGSNCRIGPDVVLESSCVLGDGVRITRSMVLRHALVPDGLEIEGQVVTGE